MVHYSWRRRFVSLHHAEGTHPAWLEYDESRFPDDESAQWRSVRTVLWRPLWTYPFLPCRAFSVWKDVSLDACSFGQPSSTKTYSTQSIDRNTSLYQMTWRRVKLRRPVTVSVDNNG